MASQRRSIPALNLLKAQHKARIENYHKPMQVKVVREAKEIRHKMAKAIIDDIESYAITRYPELRLLLKCESGHSTDNGGIISIGLKFEPKLTVQRDMLAKFKMAEAADLAALEDWYTEFLQSSAGGSDTPVFNLPHLVGVSAEYTHRYVSDTEI